MNKKNLYLLLTIVKNNGSIKRLTREGLTFKMIAEISNSAIKEGYLIYENNLTTLSSTGNQFIEDFGPEFKLTNKDEWIQKDFSSKIKRLEKDFIFLPNQNELNF